MKKTLLVLVSAVFLCACGLSAEEKLVSDYEQQLGDTKVDLNLKVKESTFIGETFYSDSIPKLAEYIDFKVNEKIESLTRMYDMLDKMEELPGMVDLYKGDKKGTFLEKPYKRLLFYQENDSEKIGDVWQMTYSIENPLLGGTEQELTKKYLISPDKSKIITTISDD